MALALAYMGCVWLRWQCCLGWGGVWGPCSGLWYLPVARRGIIEMTSWITQFYASKWVGKIQTKDSFIWLNLSPFRKTWMQTTPWKKQMHKTGNAYVQSRRCHPRAHLTRTWTDALESETFWPVRISAVFAAFAVCAVRGAEQAGYRNTGKSKSRAASSCCKSMQMF